MNQYIYKTCDPQQDRDAIIELYDAVRDELQLPDRRAVTEWEKSDPSGCRLRSDGPHLQD